MRNSLVALLEALYAQLQICLATYPFVLHIEYRLFYRALSQKRRTILRSWLDLSRSTSRASCLSAKLLDYPLRNSKIRNSKIYALHIDTPICTRLYICIYTHNYYIYAYTHIITIYMHISLYITRAFVPHPKLFEIRRVSNPSASINPSSLRIEFWYSSKWAVLLEKIESNQAKAEYGVEHPPQKAFGAVWVPRSMRDSRLYI